MAEKAQLVPAHDDGPLARAVFEELRGMMLARKDRPLGQTLAKDFADRLRAARFEDQKRWRRA